MGIEEVKCVIVARDRMFTSGNKSNKNMLCPIGKQDFIGYMRNRKCTLLVVNNVCFRVLRQLFINYRTLYCVIHQACRERKNKGRNEPFYAHVLSNKLVLVQNIFNIGLFKIL